VAGLSAGPRSGRLRVDAAASVRALGGLSLYLREHQLKVRAEPEEYATGQFVIDKDPQVYAYYNLGADEQKRFQRPIRRGRRPGFRNGDWFIPREVY